MKYILLTLIVFFFIKCTSNENKNKDGMLGDDVRLYEGTPIWEIAKAVEKDDTSKLKNLLSGNNSMLNYQEKRFGQSILEWAVSNDHYPSTKILAEFGADPNLQSYNGTSAFIEAANKYTSEYLILLLKYGGDVNAVAQTKEAEHLRTPLMAAAYKSLQNVKILVESGADANYVCTVNGIQSALVYAFYSGKIDIVKYLIMDVGVDYKKATGVTIDGDSLYVTDDLRNLLYPLNSEEYKKKMELVDFLKEKGIDYKKASIPKNYYENYDSSYLEKY